MDQRHYNPDCLHCVVAKAIDKFISEHGQHGGVEIVTDLIASLTEVVCSAMIKTAESGAVTEEQVLSRMLHIVVNILPQRVAEALPQLRADMQRSTH